MSCSILRSIVSGNWLLCITAHTFCLNTLMETVFNWSYYILRQNPLAGS